MNRSNNERFQATENQIIDAFTTLLAEKEVSEITVREICRMCGIHRSSFYLHFQDVLELMERIERRLARSYADIFEHETEHYDIGQRFAQLFQFILEHQAFYRAYWHRSSDLHVLDATLSNETEQKMKRAAAEYGFRTDAERLYHRIFFKSGLAALIGCWLSRDCAESPAELSDILMREYWNRT